MSLSLSDLLTSLTSDNIRDTAYGILQALGFSTTSWRPGAISRTLIDLLSRVVAPFTNLQVQATSSGFLDYATGDWLTILAQQVYGVDRNLATFAPGFVTVNNSAGGVYSFPAFSVRFINPTSGKAFTNTAAFSVNALQTGVVVPIQAIEAGSASTSSPGTITQFETTYIGLSVTNANAVVGDDDETDDSVRLRCRAKLGALSPMGPQAVYDFVARTQSLNGGVLVTKTNVQAESTTGDVLITLANDSGALSGGDVAKVQNGFDLYAAPQCIEPTAVSAVALSIDVVCTVWVYTSQNLNTSDIQASVASALTAYFKSIPIGGFVVPPNPGMLFVDSLEVAIGKAVPAFRVEVTTPSSDVSFVVPPSTLQVAELGGGSLTNVVQVVGP